MKLILDFLKIIRWKNILITAFTQYFLYYAIINPGFQIANVTPTLDHFHFSIFVLITLIITASGFIVNDILDYPIDRINKPDGTIIGPDFTANFASNLYYFILIFGFTLACYLAWHVNNYPYAIMYPCAVGLLYLYSKYFKSKALIGNLVVASFVACVNLVILLAERPGLNVLSAVNRHLYDRIFEIFIAFSVFAFCLTVFREIVKDIEDIEGDQQMGCSTLPILYGIKKAKLVSFIFLFFQVVCLTYWGISQYYLVSGINTLSMVFGIGLPTLVLILYLFKAESKSDYERLSKMAKVIMISGQIYMLFFNLKSYVN